MEYSTQQETAPGTENEVPEGVLANMILGSYLPGIYSPELKPGTPRTDCLDSDSTWGDPEADNIAEICRSNQTGKGPQGNGPHTGGGPHGAGRQKKKKGLGKRTGAQQGTCKP